MSEPTLSIGVPNFNHARFLPTALDALVSQSYRPLEIVVIDDGSKDDSVAIISSYAERFPHLRLIRHERNRGVNATLTELLHLARGEFFFAPAADDMILPGFLEKSMALVQRYPDAGLCSAQIHVVNEKGVRIRTLAENPIKGARRGYFLPPAQCASVIRKRGLWIHGNTAIFHRRAFLAAGGYREELGFYQDGFMHQVLALAHGACFVPEPLAVERQMPDTFSGRSIRNPDETRRIRDLATGYMQGEFKHLFPPSLVRRWQSRWDYWRLMGYSSTKAIEWRKGLRRLLPRRSVPNRQLYLFFCGISLLGLLSIRAAAVLLITPLETWRVLRFEVFPAIYDRAFLNRSGTKRVNSTLTRDVSSSFQTPPCNKR